MSGLRDDVRFAFRMLARGRGATVAALVTLALAIGANTAIFSVVDRALLRPLPYPGAERLVQLARTWAGDGTPSQNVPRFMMWRDGLGVFAATAGIDNGAAFALGGGGGQPERVSAARVTREFFDVLGVPPMLGRGFTAGEDAPGGARVAVLGHGLWASRFGADPSVLGRDVRLDGDPYTVIGVMPEAFDYPAGAALWVPLQLDPTDQSRSNFFDVVARARPGVDPAAVDAALALSRDRYGAAYPDDIREGERFFAVPLQQFLYGDLRPALLVLATAVGLVLLVACANLANLQLARTTVRRRELAVRAALGAGAGRLARQLLTESLLVAAAGGVAGALLAHWLVQVLVALAPASVRTLPVGLDARVLVFTAAVSMTAGILAGLLPARRGARLDLTQSLGEGAGRTVGARSGARTRHVLVVAEVALAVVLLVGAALLVRSFATLRSTDPGFATDDVLTLQLSLSEGRYGDRAALAAFADSLVERLGAVGGVESATMSVSLPLVSEGPDLPFVIEGEYTGAGDGQGTGGAYYRAVTPGFFETMDIAARAGRVFDARDRSSSALVAVVNEAFARRYFPGGEAVGRRIHVGPPIAPDLADPAPREIIGVVRDVRELGLDRAAPAIIYVPIAQMAPTLARLIVRLLPVHVLVRTAVPPASVAADVRRVVWAVDPEQPVSAVRPMTAVVAESLGSREFTMRLLGVFAAVALGLAAVGLYGVLAYLVAQRTREIGLRMALGASRRAVMGLVLRQGLASVVAGAGLGLVAAAWATRGMASLLHGVGPADLLSFALAPAVLAVAALTAIWVPARRAARVDPMTALRAE